MSGAGLPPSAPGKGIRRKYSTDSTADDAIANTPYTIPASGATSSAVESAARPSMSSLESQRVRFSRNGIGGGDGGGQHGKTSGPGMRTELPDLRVETREDEGEGRSPLSPTSRSRGYSLRSALFRKNVQGSSSTASNIELDEGVGASRSTTGQHNGASHGDSLKGGDAIITATPEQMAYASEASDLSKAKLGKGPVALPNYDRWLHGRKAGRRSGAMRKMRDAAELTRKYIFRIKDVPPSKDGRHISVDASRIEPLVDERTNQPYTTNWIRSTRYSAWNFVPRQLVAQFSKLANFYFLMVSILQLIPGLSTTGTYTTIVPLMFFVTLSIVKEGYDDLRRYRLDKEENRREAQVLRASLAGAMTWEKIQWQNIHVGDIIKLNRNDAAPADLALLHTTGDNNVAYVETMALDGETNLKSKQSTSCMSKAIINAEDILRSDAEFVVEDPNRDLYSFEGRVTVNAKQAPLTLNEIIFRGSVLRNTPDAIGMVIYSGEECRIRMNANKNPRIKAPALQSKVNRIVILIVIFVVLLSVFNAVAYRIWRRAEGNMAYLASATVSFFPSFTAFIIMFNTMIPLSLYVSLEIVKLAQMFFLHADMDMYDPETDTPCEPRTSTINEELGQVGYVFSDKTGTLTDNEMRFRKVSVGGAGWLHDVDLKAKEGAVRKVRKKGKEKAKRKSFMGVRGASTDGRQELEEAENAGETAWRSSAKPMQTARELRTQDMLRYIRSKPHTPFSKKARMFLLSLALCHTCLPEVHEDGKTHFMASSPDELALVQAAQDLGFLLVNRDVHTITLNTPGLDGDTVSETYEILDVIEFSSKRKRMSIILRFPDGRICIICKGADSIVMQRLKLATLANRKMVEIERRANKRKSMEAQQAIARMSEQHERRSSMMGRKSSIGVRPSLSFSQAARASLNIGRPSLARREHSARDEMDEWLRERENDIDLSSLDDSPRPSGLGRYSVGVNSVRSSMQLEDMDALVDETVAADETLVIERTLQHINDFATEGLRTLLYAYRFIPEHEYLAWKKIYLDATTSLVDRTRLIEDAGDMIEQSLDLCAATAIEDKLQSGVPSAIDKLRRANIRTWMLTGDKRETAINIGYACRLIKDYSAVTLLDHEAGALEQRIAQAILAIQSGGVPHSVVVVDGTTLTHITLSPTLTPLFYSLAILASSVICCRASPSQKALLVRNIRKRVGAVTLAIGDGANDIAMIQEAHVGVGITGKEGLQAARSSDYSVGRFRFLVKLLVVHGRWCYGRTCRYTVGTFWKEMLFYLTQALYQRSVGYTGTSLYEPWSLSMFNTLFTSLPVIFMGVFDQDLSASTLLAVPELYTNGQRNGSFNFSVYLGWMFMASGEAMVVYFCMLGLYGNAHFSEDSSVFALGSITYTAVVWLIALKMQFIESHTLTATNALAILLSIGGWFLWNILLSALYKAPNQIYYVRDAFLRGFGATWTWWLSLTLILAASLVFELSIHALRATWFPTDVDVFQRLEKDPQVRRRFEEASKGELGQGWDCEMDGAGEGTWEGAREREREREVGELLRRRGDGEGREEGEDGGDVDRVLSRGFGDVRAG